MTARQPGAAAEVAALPVRLASLAALLVELGAKHVTAVGGTRSAMRDLPELQRVLGAAVASASGCPPRTMEPQSRPAELTTSEAAALMGISARRVRHHARNGRLIARKRARDWLIDAASARDYRKENGW
jgi:hypothetical protein